MIDLPALAYGDIPSSRDDPGKVNTEAAGAGQQYSVVCYSTLVIRHNELTRWTTDRYPLSRRIGAARDTVVTSSGRGGGGVAIDQTGWRRAGRKCRVASCYDGPPPGMASWRQT